MITNFSMGHITLNVDKVGVSPTNGFNVEAKCLFQPLKDTLDTGIKNTINVVGELKVNTKISYIRGSKSDKIIVKNEDLNAYRFRLTLTIDDYLEEDEVD